MYQLSDDGNRVPMLNRTSSVTADYRVAIYGGYNNFMINGKVNQTLSAGLGCVLIKRKSLKRVEFRHIEGASWFPDVVWINDLFRSGVPYYVHSGIICTHKNSHWGVFGKDYN